LSLIENKQAVCVVGNAPTVAGDVGGTRKP